MRVSIFDGLRLQLSTPHWVQEAQLCSRHPPAMASPGYGSAGQGPSAVDVVGAD